MDVSTSITMRIIPLQGLSQVLLGADGFGYGKFPPAVVTMNELGIAKNTAWFLNHRIRKAFENNVNSSKKGRKFTGEVEFDETFIGGKAANIKKSTKERFKKRGGGQGGAGKQIVIAARERASGKVISEVIEDRTKKSMQGFVESVADENAVVLTGEARAYKGVDREHKTVNHSAKEYSKEGVNVAILSLPSYLAGGTISSIDGGCFLSDSVPLLPLIIARSRDLLML